MSDERKEIKINRCIPVEETALELEMISLKLRHTLEVSTLKEELSTIKLHKVILEVSNQEMRRGMIKNRQELVRELTTFANIHCLDNELGTPDFIIAEAVVKFLGTMKLTTQDRDKWFGHPSLAQKLGLKEDIGQTIDGGPQDTAL